MGLVGSKRPASYRDSDSHSLICQAGTRRPHPGGRGGGSHPHTPPGPTEGGPHPPDAPQPARAPPLSLWAGEEGSLTPPGSSEDSRFPHSRGGCLMLTITWRLLTADERPCLSSCLQWAGLSPTLDGPWHPGGLTPFWALPGASPEVSAPRLPGGGGDGGSHAGSPAHSVLPTCRQALGAGSPRGLLGQTRVPGPARPRVTVLDVQLQRQCLGRAQHLAPQTITGHRTHGTKAATAGAAGTGVVPAAWPALPGHPAGSSARDPTSSPGLSTR